ncbi:hypothetical protein [Roseibacillus ishigakijimensis]|uniref:Lipoprotein n=1 Tax=Roseibacillus ishigakijimensis TaxID=454146 RepID=A0A934RS28_9BACT|nr:hypothetical protein [Roseibacillus ishigakijimensis]MBK1834418.1 hypothetical protein [Roseibacillus ishigakijimensis]
MSTRLFPIIVFSLLTLLSCSPSRESSSWKQTNEALMQNLRETDSLAAIRIPILRSPTLEKNWGPPTIETSPQGTYRLSYQHPEESFERLVIYGSPLPFPVLSSAPDEERDHLVDGELGIVTIPQSWRSTNIMDREIRWFTETTGGGADGDYFSTEGFPLTAPDGRTGHYRLVVESITDQAAPRFAQVGW